MNSFSRRDELFAGPSRRPRVWVLAVGATVVTSILASGWIGRGSPVNGGAAEDAFWKIGKPVAIAVRDGRSTFRVPTPSVASEVLVVVSALVRSGGPFPISITARQTKEVAVPLLADDGPRRLPRLAGAPAVQPTDAAAPRGDPPLERAFHMLVRDGDPASPSNYAAIRGVLKGVGRKIQVYIAAEDVEQVSGDLVRDLILTFDDQVYPLSARGVGTARDVDGDGRFTILLSSWLDHLGGGRYPVDGFVRVADLDPAYHSPFGNQCDMMYLNTALKEGPHTRTLLAHEYMHAVVFTQKTFRSSHALRLALEEEGWLDEAMAHVAEDMQLHFPRQRAIICVSAFFELPRTITSPWWTTITPPTCSEATATEEAHICSCDGALIDTGQNCCPPSVHSQQKGAANLEVATGATFGDLYRRLVVGALSEWPGTDRGEGSPGCGRLRVAECASALRTMGAGRSSIHAN